jgi:toxin ParE1/3/4
MPRTLRYHPLFHSDVIDGADWYDARHPSLGTDFVTRVRSAVNLLIEDPERRTASDYGVRYWPVERFPYVIFYDLLNTEVILLGVMHTSQDSTKWLLRRP